MLALTDDSGSPSSARVMVTPPTRMETPSGKTTSPSSRTGVLPLRPRVADPLAAWNPVSATRRTVPSEEEMVAEPDTNSPKLVPPAVKTDMTAPFALL